MSLTAAYAKVSGTGLRSCATLVTRYFEEDGRFRPESGESWVCRNTPDGISETLYRHTGWLTGLWRSETGRLYVTDIRRKILHWDPDKDDWQTHSVPINPMGIWGLGDGSVYAWGMGDNKAPTVLRWNGRDWSALPPPSDLVWAMHGTSDDLVFAVGDNGMIDRWDGASWTSMPFHARKTLNRVFVVSEDEAYACGSDGELLQGSVYGWTRLVEIEHAIMGVAKWKDDLWVGTTGPLGLCKWSEEDGLVSIKENVKVLHLDARDDLVMVTGDLIVATADGENFSGLGTKWFMRATDHRAPSWE